VVIRLPVLLGYLRSPLDDPKRKEDREEREQTEKKIVTHTRKKSKGKEKREKKMVLNWTQCPCEYLPGQQ
jgi:hypothetical protein